MKILHIALKDLKTVFRDVKALALMLLMPSLLIIVLGLALGPMFDSEQSVSRFAVAVVDKDSGDISRILTEDILKDSMKELFYIETVDEAEADRMLQKGEVHAAVIIPGGFSEKVEAGSSTDIEVRSTIDSEFHSGIVESVVSGFAESVTLNQAVYGAVMEMSARGSITQNDTAAILQKFLQGMDKQQLKFEEQDQQKVKIILSALDFYAAAMLVMFILFGANQGTKMIIEERESRTLGRIISTGTGKFRLVAGKFTGLMIICLIQSVILIAFTRFAYGVYWGDSTVGIALVTICAVFAGSSFGMFIAAIARTAKAADSIGVVLIQVFTLVGGGMVPYYVMPDFLKAIAKVTLNWWAVRGYHELMLGTDLNSILLNCGILMLMGVGYLTAGIAGFRTGRL